MKQFIKEAEKLEKLYMKFSQNKATQQQVEKQYEIILNIIKKNEDSLNKYFQTVETTDALPSYTTMYEIEKNVFKYNKKYLPLESEIKKIVQNLENDTIIKSRNDFLKMIEKRHHIFIQAIEEAKKITPRKVKKRVKNCHKKALCNVLYGTVIIMTNCLVNEASGTSIIIGSKKIICDGICELKVS